MTEQKGLILINTGTGKGKTTAALGTAIRAWGNGQKVLILQFIKGAWKYGELKAIEALEACNGNIEIRPMGDGFVFHNRKEDEAAYQNKKELAARAWGTVVDEVMSDRWDLVVLDEKLEIFGVFALGEACFWNGILLKKGTQSEPILWQMVFFLYH